MKKGLTIIAGGIILSAAMFSCNNGAAEAEKAKKTADSLATVQLETMKADSIKLKAKEDSLAAVIKATQDTVAAVKEEAKDVKEASDKKAKAEKKADTKKKEEVKKVEETKKEEVKAIHHR